jgi:ribosomal protein L40E
MTQKEVGYVELEWTCPRCDTRNPGTVTTCKTCGAPQPENVQFSAPVQAELVQDQQKIERAKAGPDIHCPYCGARNPATAKVCHQCGGDLTQGKARGAGKVVGAYGSPQSVAPVKCPACGMENPGSAKTCVRCGSPLGAPAPAPAPQPQPAQTGSGGGFTWILIAAGVAVVLAIAAFMFFVFRTEDKVAVVQEARWQRTLPVLGLLPVRSDAWRDQIPGGAEVLSCAPRVRSTSSEPQPGAREVCGTPYTEDTGTGMGRVVQDCEYEIMDDWCSYSVLQWTVVNTLMAEGVGFEPRWPSATLEDRQRLGDGTERFSCVFTVDDKEYSYTVSSFAEYERCRAGTRWKLEINGLGDVVGAELQQ